MKELELSTYFDKEFKVIDTKVLRLSSHTLLSFALCEITKGLHKGTQLNLSLQKYPKLKKGVSYEILDNVIVASFVTIRGVRREIKTNTLFFIKKK